MKIFLFISTLFAVVTSFPSFVRKIHVNIHDASPWNWQQDEALRKEEGRYDDTRPMIPIPHNNCSSGISERPSWHELSLDDKNEYIKAVKCLMDPVRSPSTRPPFKGSQYDDFVYHHMDTAKRTHFTPSFLAFHRAFIYAYEVALQQCGGRGEYANVKLAYWDVALDAFNPAQSEIFSEQYFGGNGQASDSCVQSGQFAGKMNIYPIERCLRRSFILNEIKDNGNAETAIGAKFSESQLRYETANGRNRSFGYFRDHLETTIHEVVHLAIGGIRGDMSTGGGAANDPLFFLHHSNIDRIWNDWQKALPDLAHDYDGKDEHGREVSLDDEVWLGGIKDLLPFGWDKHVLRVRDLENIGQWCYSYSDGVRRGTGGALIKNPNPGVSRIQMGISSIWGSSRWTPKY
jgi:hypothetical protein